MTTEEQIAKAKIEGFDALNRIGELQEALAIEQKNLADARRTVAELEIKLKEK